MKPDSTAPAAPRHPALALPALSLMMLLPSLGVSIANIALPALAQSFGASFAQVQWVVLAFLLAMSTTLVSAGRLGDLVGRGKLAMGGIALFVAGSVLCALAPSLLLLVTARAVQGLGAAVMMALAMALAAETVPGDRIGRAMGLLTTMSAAGTALGPTLGGLLIGWLGWPGIFLVHVPLGLLAFGMAHLGLPRQRPGRGDVAGFDHRGTLALAATLGAYAIAVTLHPRGFGVFNALCLLAAAAGALLFVRIEAGARSPLLPIALLRDAQCRASLAMNTLVASVLMGSLVVGPFYLTGTLGLSAAAAGLAMSAGPLVAVLAGLPAGRLVDGVGHRASTQFGLYTMAAGTLMLALPPMGDGVAAYLGPLVILTAGYALFQAANNSAVMAGASPRERGAMGGVLTLSRNIGLISGAALIGALFAHGVGSADMARATPGAIGAGMHLSYAAATLILAAAILMAHAAGRRQSPAAHGSAPREPGQ